MTHISPEDQSRIDAIEQALVLACGHVVGQVEGGDGQRLRGLAHHSQVGGVLTRCVEPQPEGKALALQRACRPGF